MEQNAGSPEFVDRRSNIELRSLIDFKVKELDEKRESNLKFKLDAIEKLFVTTIETKSEALTIAVSRIQGENSACANRCREQVNKFYDLINGQREEFIRTQMIIGAIKSSILELENDVNSLSSTTVGLGTFNEIRTKVNEDIELRVSSLEKWKELDLKRSIIITIITLCTTLGVMIPTTAWLYEHLVDK